MVVVPVQIACHYFQINFNSLLSLFIRWLYYLFSLHDIDKAIELLPVLSVTDVNCQIFYAFLRLLNQDPAYSNDIVRL
jgi:hypothetical protein